MRIEKKYTFDLNNYNILVDQIINSKFLFIKKYKKRIVNSIYLDNEFMQNYSDNLSGISKRSKIRLRYYNEDLEIKTNLNNKFNLEVKVKNNQVVNKKIYSLNLPSNILKKIDNRLIIFLLKKVPILIKPFILEQTLSTIGITYNREYFESKIFNLRCTIDTNLKFWKPHNVNLLNNKKIFSYNTEYGVLEMKFPHNDKRISNEKFNDLINYITPSRHSKYSVGCNLIYK
tara:strand:- start:122 stop:811 length:690 start_codon:yes stop_codon:yes gene_type:complete